MSIELKGLDEVLERLDLSVEEVAKNMGKACALVEGAAKRNAPKGTGELRRSITSKVEVQGTDVVGVVFTPLEYAPYVEYGTGLFAENGGRQDVPWCYKDDKGEWHTTSGQHPQPYMRPALYSNREQIKRLLKEGLLGD
jgi:HK97 gp10 family phage protein